MVCSDLEDGYVVCVVGQERVEIGNLKVGAIAGVGRGWEIRGGELRGGELRGVEMRGWEIRGGGGEVLPPGEVCREAGGGGGLLPDQWGVEGVRAVGKGG